MTFKKGKLPLLGLLFSYSFISGLQAQPSLISPADRATNTSSQVELKTFVAGASVISSVTFHTRLP